MENILKLAKKFSKSRKFRLLIIATVAKILISAIVFLAIGFWASQATEAQAAYGLSPDVKQVKVAGSPTVYYLDHKLGAKKAYISSAAYLSYGNKWPDIKTISRAQLNKWPDVKLIKLAGDKKIYYVSGNKKTYVKNPAELAALGLGKSKIAAVNQTDFLSFKIAEPKTVAVVKAGGGPSGTLAVEFDQASVTEDYFPLNSRHNLAAVFNLIAGGQTVEVSKITFKVQGIFKSEGVDKVYLTGADGKNLGEPAELNNKRAMFDFSDAPLIIPAGETEKIYVYLDLKSYPDFLNHWLQVSLAAAGDIKASADIGGSFPVNASQYKLLTGEVLGQVKVTEQAVNAGNLTIGQSQKLIAKFIISETTGQEDAVLDNIVLTNQGSAGAGELTNFKLKDKYNHLIAQTADLSGDQSVTLNLNNAFIIANGSSGTLLLFADIAGGENKTVNLNVRDFNSSGDGYGYGLALNKTDSNETLTISREPVSIFNKELKPGKRTLSRQRGQIFGNFQIRNNNQKIYLRNINISLDKTADAPALNSLVYLVNYDTGDIYSSAAGDKLTGGALKFNGLGLGPRQILNFSLVSSLPGGTLSGDKYRMVINKISYQYDGGITVEDAIGLKGNHLTATESSLFIFANGDWDKNLIKGQKNIKIASWILEAAAGDNVDISQIILAKSGETGGAALYENGFSNLRLTINGGRVGAVIEKPISANYVFDNFIYHFTAGARAELSLAADTDADLKADQVQLAMASILAESRNSGAASAVAGVNTASAPAAFGQSSAELKAISAGSFAAGQKDNEIGRFSVANTGAEDIRLDNLNIVTTSDGLSNSLGFSNLSITAAGKSSRVGAISKPVAGANKISLGGFTVKTGQAAEFIIKVSASDSVSLDSFDIYLSELKARGVKSKLDVKVQGDPSDFIAVSAAAAGDDDSDTGEDNGNGTGEVSLSWPVSSRKVNYGFHDPAYPFRDSVGEHNAIDIDVAQGTAVKAAADGVVVALADNNTTAYDYITIDHGQGIKTTYGHLSALRVKLGDAVTPGQVIALSGGKPGTIGAGSNTTGAHLHFEVNQNGIDVDPMGFLK
ncbi:MAG: M23 family metallopeptidase [bacterium]|nr:M23 family metallopeptidase [bacterium]